MRRPEHHADIPATQIDLEHADASQARFDRAELQGANFRAARLDGASLASAIVCNPENDRDGLSLEKIQCANFAGATLRGADLTGVRYCRRRRSDCRPVTRDELQTIAHANLEGARF